MIIKQFVKRLFLNKKKQSMDDISIDCLFYAFLHQKSISLPLLSYIYLVSIYLNSHSLITSSGIEELVKTYSNEGDTVLDNCMGSGTTGVACKNLNRNFIGIEKDENYFNIARERIYAT